MKPYSKVQDLGLKHSNLSGNTIRPYQPAISATSKITVALRAAGVIKIILYLIEVLTPLSYKFKLYWCY